MSKLDDVIELIKDGEMPCDIDIENAAAELKKLSQSNTDLTENCERWFDLYQKLETEALKFVQANNDVGKLNVTLQIALDEARDVITPFGKIPEDVHLRYQGEVVLPISSRDFLAARKWLVKYPIEKG
jgi:hypothetical protein